MPHFRLVLEYDGSGFEGWQIQPGEHRTVQGVLEAGLSRICGGAPVRVRGSGRTDTGVHAEGQVAAVELSKDFSVDALKRAVNAVLPQDVSVVLVDAVPATFDPRRAAISKLYRYCIWNGPERSPLRSARWLEIAEPLDVAAMNAAAALLVGHQDFASFQAAGSAVECSVRTLSRCQVLGEAGSELRIECEGSGFLRHMVRNIAGTLLEVGLSRRRADSMPSLLAARSRPQAGPTAAARGLTLVRVDYAPTEASESA